MEGIEQTTKRQLNTDEPRENCELLPQLTDPGVREVVRRNQARWAFTFTILLVAFIEGVQLHRDCTEAGVPYVAYDAGKRGLGYVRTLVWSFFSAGFKANGS